MAQRDEGTWTWRPFGKTDDEKTWALWPFFLLPPVVGRGAIVREPVGYSFHLFPAVVGGTLYNLQPGSILGRL